VPVCYALVSESLVSEALSDVIYTAVDHKPKRSQRLRRTANIAATGVACLLVDHYDEDWSALWWVRLDCAGRVVTEPAEREVALAALTGRYEQYARRPPEGPVLALEVRGWAGWSAAGS
jgi:PPOX class probable F420-dependent enzyme